MGGIFDLLDAALAAELNTDIQTYNDIINNYCTYWEAKFIIFAFMSNREDKFNTARQIFNSHLTKRSFNPN
jgi:uncharacterized protein YutD